MTTVLIYFTDFYNAPINPKILMVYNIIIFAGIYALIDNWLQTFISWKKGSKCWVKFAPYLYFFNLHMTFVVLPLILITYITF